MIKYDFSWNMTRKLRKQKMIRKFEKTPGQNVGKSVRVGENTGKEKSWAVFCFCKHRKQKSPGRGGSAAPHRGRKLRQYRIILSADTASEVRQLLSQKRR